MRGAILRVRLRKLDAIIKAMRWSKYRIRHTLEKLPGVRLRNIIDPEGGTASFLIATYASAQIAKQVNLALRAEGILTYPDGISNIVMTDWGLHLCYNILAQADRTSVDSNGFPWKLAENAGLERTCGKGTCPIADSLFEGSNLPAIPSCLKESDENDIIRTYEKVWRGPVHRTNSSL
jgi:hypothetical protein